MSDNNALLESAKTCALQFCSENPQFDLDEEKVILVFQTMVINNIAPTKDNIANTISLLFED